MPRIITLLALWLFAGFTMANNIETIYLTNGKVEFDKTARLTDQPSLRFFIDSKSLQYTYQFKPVLGDTLIDAGLYNDRLTIMLTASKTHQVLIINVKTGTVVDHFWGHRAVLAPNGRFVVFKRFQYRNEQSQYGEPAGVTQVYDVGKSPFENRTTLAQKLLKQSPVALANVSKTAGLPVYPTGDYDQPNYGYASKREDRIAVFGHYDWYQDNAFAFITPPYNDQLTIVDAVFNVKTNRFDIKTRLLKAKDLVADSLNKPSLSILKIEKTAKSIKLYTHSSIIRLKN